MRIINENVVHLISSSSTAALNAVHFHSKLKAGVTFTRIYNL